MTRALLLSIAVLCAGACAQSSGDDRLSESPVKRASAETVVTHDAAVAPVMAHDAGPADAAASVCDDLKAAFQARLAAASDACTTARDCACFTSIVDSPACGGVIDTASARELNDLVSRFRAAGCRPPRRCGPGRCAPECVDHRCR